MMVRESQRGPGTLASTWVIEKGAGTRALVSPVGAGDVRTRDRREDVRASGHWHGDIGPLVSGAGTFGPPSDRTASATDAKRRSGSDRQQPSMNLSQASRRGSTRLGSRGSAPFGPGP